MRFLSSILPAFALLAMGCLPAYTGNAPGDLGMAPDASGEHVETPPEGPASPPVVPDLAGTVQVDMFVSSGTASMQLSDPTATLRLNEGKDVTINVSGNGATGTATLALKNAPAGFTATFNPPSVTLGATAIPVTMSVKAASDMDPASSVAAMVELTAGGAASTTTFGITVLPELLVVIPKGVATTANPTAFGAASIPAKLIGTGTKITFVNMDGIEHRIHADGTGGLAHEPNNMAANGGSYTGQVINAKGTIGFYCHIHPGMKGSLNIQ